MDLASPQLHKSGKDYFVTHGEDKELYVEFENIPVHQEAESIEAGRAIFKDVPYITILFPGDRTKKVSRPVRMIGDAQVPSDLDRFPKQWAAFQAQESQSADGTPLSEWPMITKSQVLEYKAMNIHTVDALSALPDSIVQNLGLGATGLREQAKAWLAKANDGAEISKLVGKLQDQSEQIELLQRQIKDLTDLYAKENQTKPKAKAA